MRRGPELQHGCLKGSGPLKELGGKLNVIMPDEKACSVCGQVAARRELTESAEAAAKQGLLLTEARAAAEASSAAATAAQVPLGQVLGPCKWLLCTSAVACVPGGWAGTPFC